MSKSFFLRRGSQTVGPMTGKALRELAAQGKVAPTDFVKREDTDWIIAKDVDDLLLSPRVPTPVHRAAEASVQREAKPTSRDNAGEATSVRRFLLDDLKARVYCTVAGCSLGVLALSTFMPWATIFAGGVSGVRGDGKIVLALSVAAIIALLIGVYRSQWLAPIASLCMAWGTVAAAWMGVLLYKTATIGPPSDLKNNPFAAAVSSQFGPGIGLYVGLIAGVGSAVFAGLLCIRMTTPQNAPQNRKRFLWLAVGQAVAIPLVIAVGFLQLSDFKSAPRELSESDKRTQALLQSSGKVLADLKERTAQIEARTKSRDALTEKLERANKLREGGAELLDAWQQVGLLVIDLETRKVMVDSAWWSGWADHQGGRTTVVTILRGHFKLKTDKYTLTVYEADGGMPVAMVHTNGEMVILR